MGSASPCPVRLHFGRRDQTGSWFILGDVFPSKLVPSPALPTFPRSLSTKAKAEPPQFLHHLKFPSAGPSSSSSSSRCLLRTRAWMGMLESSTLLPTLQNQDLLVHSARRSAHPSLSKTLRDLLQVLITSSGLVLS